MPLTQRCLCCILLKMPASPCPFLSPAAEEAAGSRAYLISKQYAFRKLPPPPQTNSASYSVKTRALMLAQKGVRDTIVSKKCNLLKHEVLRKAGRRAKRMPFDTLPSYGISLVCVTDHWDCFGGSKRIHSRPSLYQTINLGRLKLSVLFKPRLAENKVVSVKQKPSTIYSFKEVCSCLETASK